MYDSDTKLVHFGYREYDPFTGKWSAKDPLLFGGGDSNLYGYMLGDPVDLVDPTGEFAIAIPWLTVEGAAWASSALPAALATLTLFIPGDTDDNGKVCYSKGDKMLSPGEINKLKKGGVYPHDLKENARQDLYKDKDGNIVVKPKGGNGPGEPTGLNINDF